MSPHDLPGDLNPKKLVRALVRLGFTIDTTGGKGSHLKAIWRNEKMVIIQRNLYRQALRLLLREIETVSGITWEEIKKQL